MLEAFSIFSLGLTDLLLVGIRGICWMTEVTSISLKAHLFTFGYNKALELVQLQSWYHHEVDSFLRFMS